MENQKTILSISFKEGSEEPIAEFREDNFKSFIFQNGGSHKELTHLMAHFHRFMWESIDEYTKSRRLTEA